jgi:hypothetical protein
MALLINKTGLFNVNGGQPLPSEGIFCRFKPEPALRGTGVTIQFEYFPDKDAETKWSKIGIAWEVEVEQPILNENDEQIDTQTILSKVFAPQTKVIDLASGFAKQAEVEVDAYYEGIKDTPLGQGITFQMGKYTLIGQVMFHVLAKKALEEIFGEGTVVIRIDLI